MLDKIYIIRHGFRHTWTTRESDWENITGVPYDDPLSPLGHTQAQEIAQHFLSMPEHEKPTAIFSSPTQRCIQTASPSAKALGIPVFFEHGLSEWLMPLQPNTGLHPAYPSTSELVQLFSGSSDNYPLSDSWKSIWIVSRRGEDVDGLHRRMEGVAKVFVWALDEDLQKGRDVTTNVPDVSFQYERIAVFGHVAPLIGFIRALVGDRIPVLMGVGSITTLTRARTKDESTSKNSECQMRNSQLVATSDFKSKWDVVSLCSHAHLSSGESKPGGFEDPTWMFPTPDKFPVGAPGTEGEEDWLEGCQVPELASLVRG